MTYIYAMALSEIQTEEMKVVEISGKAVLLANVDGQIFAMQRSCPHAGADLSTGKIVGSSVVCSKHTAAFDLATGEAVGKAKLLFLKFPTKRAETYSVKVENDSVFVAV